MSIRSGLATATFVALTFVDRDNYSGCFSLDEKCAELVGHGSLGTRNDNCISRHIHKQQTVGLYKGVSPLRVGIL